MKKLLVLCLIVLGLATEYLSEKTTTDHQDLDESPVIVTLGFDNSGTPKSIEEDWGG